ncbi:MAG TPA: bi-domain-containing oxidoreductase [bacterium]|nr:bi-domain-containing oxidoreductase [bacterium]HPQ65409.1 bi-domain-containing oxidoreductase [bacterium]
MKQLLQHLRTGEIEVAEVPSPIPGPGEVLIRNRCSLISAGTERMLVEFSQANLVSKARRQPEKVRQVLDKMKTDGVVPTLEAVFRKLDQPLPLGYCSAGEILEVGANVHDFKPGDRVASNGSHAEFVCVPRNLCARIPLGVSYEDASFTVLASIALQGVRLAQPTLGETFMVFGMGLLGLLSTQILTAHGCRVLAVDLRPDRLELARAFKAVPIDISAGIDPIQAAADLTEGRGVDGVLITASARDDQIVHQSARACRKRGRIVLVGVVDLNLRRSDFYEKELSFQVSCSYGPGRYDPAYEQGGHDYPFGFVRWTEARNFHAVLEAMAAGRIVPGRLITDAFPLHEAGRAYRKISEDSSGLGVLLTYDAGAEYSNRVSFPGISLPGKSTNAEGVGVIGAGNFAFSILLPHLAKSGAVLQTVADFNPSAARQAANKFGFRNACTDYRDLLSDSGVGTVFILSGHSSHARLVLESLEAGKNVFVEKPLAISRGDLDRIAELIARRTGARERPLLMVGFNRRFSPHITVMTDLLRGRTGPLCLNMTVNAGYIPRGHWTQDPILGGGRIIGEGCHFIDLLAFLTGSRVEAVSSFRVGPGTECSDDKTSILLKFSDGSIGTVNYFANGARSYPKETLEVFGEGRILRMENFRITRGWGFRGFSRFRTRRQEKGHREEISAFLNAAASGQSEPISFPELYNSSLAAIMAVEAADTEAVKSLEVPGFKTD